MRSTKISQTLLRTRAVGMIVAFVLAISSAPSRADDRGVYDVFLGSVPVGVFAYSGVEARGRYSLAGQLRTTGLIGAVTNVRYDAKTVGRISGGNFVPSVYEEQATIGNRKTDLKITYRNGVPSPPVFSPPRDDDRPSVNPAEQGDALDLLTALYILFRETPLTELCSFRTFIFDGVRRTSLSLRTIRRSPTEVVCRAEYRRIAGFSVAELRRRETFDFQLIYTPVGNGFWQVERADLESVYGVVSLNKRPTP